MHKIVGVRKASGQRTRQQSFGSIRDGVVDEALRGGNGAPTIFHLEELRRLQVADFT